MFSHSLSIARLPHLRPSLPLRPFSTTPSPLTSFSRPSPLPLPRADQQEFEELLRRVQNPARPSAAGADAQADEASMHPDYRPKPKSKWQGKTNPTTGEVDGPKHEPLEHGQFALGCPGCESGVSGKRWLTR